MADQSLSEKEEEIELVADLVGSLVVSSRDKSMGPHPSKRAVTSGSSSDNNNDSSSSLSLQARLAYNRKTIADNGKVMSRLFKKVLRQRHGYCLGCQGPPVLLYEVVPVVVNDWDSKTPKTKLGNPKSVGGECHLGICLKCQQNKISINHGPESNNGILNDSEDKIADKCLVAKKSEDLGRNEIMPMPSDLDVTPPSLVRQSGIYEEPGSTGSTPSDSVSPPVILAQQNEANRKPKFTRTSSNFLKEGVRFSYILNEFCTQHSLEGLTTTEVCETIIKPTTARQQSSFCQLLQETNPSAYGEMACLFVSHAHQYLFLDVISALKYHLRDEPDLIIWFDLFSINQHQPLDWTFEWLSTTFKTAIQDMGRTVMVMSPWNDPIPFTRSWCIFEAYSTGVTNGKYEIALSKKDRQQFLNDIIRDPKQSIEKMLSNIRAEKSTCSKEWDKRQIFLVIYKSIGFSGISEMVFEKYREWVVQVPLVEGLNQCKQEEEKMILKRSLGILYLGQGKYRYALAFLQDAYRKQSELLGINHPDTHKTALGLLELFIMLGKYPHSMEMLKVVCKKPYVLSEDGVNLFALEMHALLRLHRGEYKHSCELYRICWVRRHHYLGEDHPLTLNAMSAYSALVALRTTDLVSGRVDPDGGVSLLLDRFDGPKAVGPDGGVSLLLNCFDRQKAVMGEKHPQTLATMHQLAVAYSMVENNAGSSYMDEARRLHELCLKRRIAILGASHPKTLESMVSLARVCDSHSKHSVGLMEDCLTKRREVLGIWHPDTQAICDSLATIYISQKKLGKAQSLYTVYADKVSSEMLAIATESAEQLFLKEDQEKYGDFLRRAGRCVMIKKILLGIQHEDTMRSMVDLGLMYKAAGRLHAGLSLLQTALAIQEQTLGEDHKETMTTHIHLETIRNVIYLQTFRNELYSSSAPLVDYHTIQDGIGIYEYHRMLEGDGGGTRTIATNTPFQWNASYESQIDGWVFHETILYEPLDYD